MASSIPDKKSKIIGETLDIMKDLYKLDSLYIFEKNTKIIEKIDKYRKEKLGIEDKDYLKNMDKMVREDIKRKRDFLNGFGSDTFYLEKDKIKSNDNLIRVVVKDNIKFPELYSDIAISKARKKDSINEDILGIGYTLCSLDIVNDLINYKFDKRYFIDLPKSILEKVTKKNRLLGIIDNEYILEHICLVVSFDCFTVNRTSIIDLMHDGYKFSLYLDDSFDYSTDNLEYL